jgi:hypothetical protein
MRVPLLVPKNNRARGLYHILIGLVGSYLGLMTEGVMTFYWLSVCSLMNVVVGYEMATHDSISYEHA